MQKRKRESKGEQEQNIWSTYEKPIQHKIFIKLKIKIAFLLDDYNGTIFYESSAIGKMCATKRVYDNTHSYTHTAEHSKKYQIPMIQ